MLYEASIQFMQQEQYTTFAEALMKSYRWLTLIAALLITLGEVLVFKSQAAQAPQTHANAAAAQDAGSGTHSPAGRAITIAKPHLG